MKRFIRILSVIVCFILLLSNSLSIYASDTSIDEQNAVIKDQKVYSNATIDQNFANNRVIVVMNGKVGSINRSYNANYFGISEIESISDLTEIKTSSTLEVEKGLSAATNDAEYKEKNEDLTSRINVENYRQILLLNLSTSNKQNVLEIIKMLEKMEGVVYAGPDYSCGQPGIIPDDSDYEDQWGLSAISASNAWDISTGSTTIRVGVMDTGIADHPDLRENVIEGWDFYNENAVTDDDTNGHGTHVAGIIGAVSNNDLGVTGVAWNVSLVPLQIINDKNSSYTSDVIQAITYAINNNISIINHSWWNYQNDFAFKTAIANYPGLYVCIAGNAGEDIDLTPNYPASFKTKNMISVSNLESASSLNSSSNYGVETVHISAPGTNVRSCYPNPEYRSLTGTSMAAPHVAGVAVLIKCRRPDLTALEIKELILNNVDVLDQLEEVCITGGRLNAYKAVLAATEAPTFTGDVNGVAQADLSGVDIIIFAGCEAAGSVTSGYNLADSARRAGAKVSIGWTAKTNSELFDWIDYFFEHLHAGNTVSSAKTYADDKMEYESSQTSKIYGNSSFKLS